MKNFLTLLCVIACSAGLRAAPGPIRVLFLGQDGGDATKHCHVLMREFGRDAIWFDYTADAATVTPEWAARFDAVLLDAPREIFKAVAMLDAKRVVSPEFPAEDKAWTGV